MAKFGGAMLLNTENIAKFYVLRTGRRITFVSNMVGFSVRNTNIYKIL